MRLDVRRDVVGAYISTHELASLLGCTRTHATRLVASGEVPGWRANVGPRSHWRVDFEWVEEKLLAKERKERKEHPSSRRLTLVGTRET